LGSQYGDYTQPDDFASQDEQAFGPGADQGSSQERLFGEIQHEAPQASPPPSYTPIFQHHVEEIVEEDEQGRGKRTKRKRVIFTPSTH
jgi:hypothetical protein